MTTMTDHTPALRLAVGAETDDEHIQLINQNGQHVARVEIYPLRETAGTIVRAVNAHDELLAALNGVLDIMSYYHKAALPENANHGDVCGMPDNCGHCVAVRQARAALAAAGA